MSDWVNRALDAATQDDVRLTATQRWAIEGPGGGIDTVLGWASDGVSSPEVSADDTISADDTSTDSADIDRYWDHDASDSDSSTDVDEIVRRVRRLCSALCFRN